MKIGLIDIDTSHPENWIPFIREMGHEIVAIWDGGSVHFAGYVREFASQHRIPIVADHLEELVDRVDCVIMHSCNWDLHVQRAAPFVAAKKAVLIDKPLAGRLGDLQQLLRWEREGARISGGSSLRFTVEVSNFLARPEEERGQVHTVFSGCGVDEFNYGIHAYALLWSVMGAGAVEVRSIGDDGAQWRIEVAWNDDRRGVLSIGPGPWIPSYATVVTNKGVHHLTPRTTPDPLYKRLLHHALPYLAGEAPPPLPMEELIEPELAAIAALASRKRNGQAIRLSDIPEDVGYDGAAFAKEYRKLRGK